MSEEKKELFKVPGRENLGLWLLGLIGLLLLGGALRLLAPVAVPIVFAGLGALLVAPLDLKLKALLPPKLKWLAHVVAVLVLLGGLVLAAGAIVFAGQQVVDAMPNLSDRLSEMLPAEMDSEGGSREIAMMWNRVGNTIGTNMIDSVTTIARTTATMTTAFATSLVLILFVVFMLLSELDVWRRKAETLWSRPSQRAWIDSLKTVSDRLRTFLAVRTGVGLLQAALYMIWLWIFGLDLLLVWGVLTFLLTYIPNLGSLIAGTLPVLYALLMLDPWTVLAVAAGLLAIEQIVGNYIDPVLLGQKLVLSPLVILVSLIFWSWYWGIAGAFLATPIMMTIMIVVNHLPLLRPVALFLSNQPSQKDLDEALAL